MKSMIGRAFGWSVNACLAAGLATAVCAGYGADPGTQSGETYEKISMVPPGDFLPKVDTHSSQPEVSRGGMEIPLRPEELTSTPLKLTVPDVERTTLSSGMRFYFYQSKDLPRINVIGIVRAGGYLDPVGKVGLADLTARMLRSGGAGGVSGDEIDRQLDALGTSIEFSAGREGVNFSMFTLTANFDKSMKILGQMLGKPDFDAKKFKQQKSLMVEELRRQNDEPSDISRREFRKIVYGPDNPLARAPSMKTLDSISLDDVRKFYEEWYRPSSIYFGVSGDTTSDIARKAVETELGNWVRPPAKFPPPPTVDEARDTTGGVIFLPKNTAQSQIRIGHLGLSRLSPEIYASSVMNDIYGMGGFSSRLMNEVRTRKGYVYGVGGGVFTDSPKGLFAAIAASKSKTTVAAIQEMLKITRGMAEAPPSPEELDTAKRDVVYSFITHFDTASEALSTQMTFDYEGYAPDYLQTYVDRIRAVTADEVQKAAGEMIHMDRMKIFVIGAEKQFDQPLSVLGRVTTMTIEDAR